MSQRIRERCPSCGAQSLMIDGDGLLVCSILECPDPTVAHRAISEFDNRHYPGELRKFFERVSEMVGFNPDPDTGTSSSNDCEMCLAHIEKIVVLSEISKYRMWVADDVRTRR